MLMRSRFAQVLTTVLLAGSLTHAQARRPTAQVAPVMESKAALPGTTVRLALRVRLPAGVHVQSNKPRDKDLIPTVLTIEPPPGVTVIGIDYPKASDLVQIGQPQPLAVFGEEFSIGVRVALARTVKPGALLLPARLRYQACNATTCFVPTRADASWTLPVRK